MRERSLYRTKSLFRILVVGSILICRLAEAFRPATLRHWPSSRHYASCHETKETSSSTSGVWLLKSSSSDNEETPAQSGIPQLPGSSSFGSGTTIPAAAPSAADQQKEKSSATAFVGTKFELQYTCNICETRNCHRVSRLAYRQGVVIARCKGCDSQHLIADNLGWTDYKGGFEGEINDIEQFFENQGKEGVVNRVSPEVFDLEKILGHDTKSGSILGENGELTME